MSLIPFMIGAVMLTADSGAASAGDEPHLAIRTGLKCSQCHVNRTGGGGRNAFGSVWAQTELPIKTFDVRSRNLNDWISIGFDVRMRFGAAIQAAQPQTQFDMPEAQVQIEGQVIPQVLTIYVDQTMGPERAFTREAFGMVQWTPANGYAKAGKMLLPYGWRIWDENAFIRSVTGFMFATPDIGVEVGLEPGPLTWAVALSNGSFGGAEGDNGKMITSQAILVYPTFRIGASASHNSQASSTRNIFGGLGGFRVGPVSILGEADWIRDKGATDRRQFAAYAEGNVWATRGVNAKITYGYHDPDLDVQEDQRIRMRFGLEIFPIPALQVSAFYELRDDPPGTSIPDVAILEFHFHF